MKKQIISMPVQAMIYLLTTIAFFWISVNAGTPGQPWDNSDSHSGAQTPMPPAFVEGEVVVKLATTDQVIMENINDQFGTTTKRFFPQLGIFLLETDEEDIEQLSENMNQLPEVVSAHPNYEIIPLQPVQGSFAFPDDDCEGSYLDQPAATSLSLATVHQISTGENINVAVIDGGVDYNHPAFEGKVISGYDYVDDDPDAFDEPGGNNSGHGTFVAGVIHLMAPDADIYAYRVSRIDGSSDGYMVAEAIMQSIVDGCNVINLSLVTTAPHEAIMSAIEFARSYNILVIAAAGNGQHATPLYPASDQYVLSVGAINQDTVPAYFSNQAEYVDVWAPGLDIYSPYLESGFAWWSGTSFAAPFVTGQAALLYSTGIPNCARDWVVEAITSTVNSFNIDGDSTDVPTLVEGGVINPLASLSLEVPMFVALIDLYNRGNIIKVQQGVTGSWDMRVLAAVTDGGIGTPYSVAFSESASFIQSWSGEELLTCYLYLHMDATGLPVGYYQDTVFLYVEGAYNSPAMQIYTLEVSEEPLTIYGNISCDDSVWTIYQGYTWPYYGSVGIVAFQQFYNNYFYLEQPYTVWQDDNPEFVTFNGYQPPGSSPELFDGITSDIIYFDIDAGSTLPPGTYYDTIYAAVENAVNNPLIQPFELTVLAGDTMWIDLADELPEGAYVELDGAHYYVYLGDIDINSTRLDTMYFSVNYSGASTAYDIDIYLKEYLPDTSAYDFITVDPRAGYTNDTICVIMDWANHNITSVGNYVRWYKVDVPEAVNTFRVLDFRFSIMEGGAASSGSGNSEVVYNISNQPNPFNPQTNIKFSLAKDEFVSLEIYNILGQNVKTLVEGQLSAGEHLITWDGTDSYGHRVGSGIYFYRITAGDYLKTRKMVLMR